MSCDAGGVLTGIKCIAIDMDGVLKRGQSPIEGSDETVGKFIAKGFKCLIVTNECRYSARQISEMLKRIGMPNAASLPVYTAMDSVKSYLQTNNLQCDFVIGSERLQAELTTSASLCQKPEKKSSVLVVGTIEKKLSTEHLQQAKDWETQSAIKKVVVLTCKDTLDPGVFPLQMPVDIVTSLQQQQIIGEGHEIVWVGKPHSIVVKAILDFFQEPAECIAFIGDTIQTDIAVAKEGKFRSVLVLSGNATPAHVALHNDIKPDFIISRLADIF